MAIMAPFANASTANTGIARTPMFIEGATGVGSMYSLVHPNTANPGSSRLVVFDDDTLDFLTLRYTSVDLGVLDPQWVDDFDIVDERLPDWAVVVERRAWGRFYGVPTQFLIDGNVVADNTVFGNDGDGISVDEADGNIVEGNLVSGNDGDGVSLDDSERNSVGDNSMCDNGDDGISLYDADENAVEYNVLCENEDEAIQLKRSDDNFIQDNEDCFGGSITVECDSKSDDNTENNVPSECD